ncbi:MAG: hypothetical protein D6813_00495 [Calditrichaeota bacterium]|nr:MAG: hypothetical protein D6813_00495 [Calditrichota bacterium]
MSLAPWELINLEKYTDPYDEIIDLPCLDLNKIKELFPNRKNPNELNFKDIVKHFNLIGGFGEFNNNDDDDDEYPGASNFI